MFIPLSACKKSFFFHFFSEFLVQSGLFRSKLLKNSALMHMIPGKNCVSGVGSMGVERDGCATESQNVRPAV